MRNYLQKMTVFFVGILATSCLAGVVTVNFPFQNIALNPGDTLQSYYSFGPYSLIFCYDNTATQGIGVFTFPYNGQIITTQLPVYLKTNGNFQGFFADPSGQLTITNNLPTTLTVNCLPAL